MHTNEPIDVVMTWVDGNDPAHREKMRPYLTEKAASRNDIAGETRFASHKEIFFCVASVLRFAPFVRKIFIVTNEQDPELDDFVKKNFPDNKIPIEIVNQNILFEGGYEECLPVFNSLSVETVLYRIPGLSENFVYMNDDFLILKPITPEEWFVGSKLVIRGKWKSIRYHSFMSHLKVITKGYRPFGYKDSMINAAKALGFKRFFNIPHTPQPEKKSLFEKFYAENPGLIVANANHRFRNKVQYNSQELACLLAVKDGKDVWAPPRSVCINITHHGRDYVKKKIALSRSEEFLWGCVQSIDQKTEEERQTIYNWLSKLYGIDLQ